MEPRMNLVSPQGTIITGTLETIAARANIAPGTAHWDEIGGFAFDYDGKPELIWEEQKTVRRDAERVFLDAQGNEYLESELVLKPVEVSAPTDKGTP